ncbi:hypothetical protein [Streptomyces sp. NPDC020780]|uniref:hypothetical protein n=1 Tax=unclassified Streptomyces TaxID=2593676 RepID=UPI0037B700BC
MNSARPLSVLLPLRTRGLIPAAQPAGRPEVSVRTVHRGRRGAVRDRGMPAYPERGRNGGIALLPRFRTDATGLTADERRALFVLAAAGAHAARSGDVSLGSAPPKVTACAR